jgi:Killing trait
MAGSDKVDLATLGMEAELVSLGTAVASVLAKLNEVTAQQQRDILRLVLGAAASAPEAMPEVTPELRTVSLPPVELEPAEPLVPEQAPDSSSRGLHPDEVRARALASVYEATAQALGQAFRNAVAAQQQLNVLGQAALAATVSTVLQLETVEEETVEEEAQPEGVAEAG